MDRLTIADEIALISWELRLAGGVTLQQRLGRLYNDYLDKTASGLAEMIGSGPSYDAEVKSRRGTRIVEVTPTPQGDLFGPSTARGSYTVTLLWGPSENSINWGAKGLTNKKGSIAALRKSPSDLAKEIYENLPDKAH